MAFAQHKARNGDQEAQKVYDQLTDAPDVLRMISCVNQEEPVGAAPFVPPPVGAERKKTKKSSQTQTRNLESRMQTKLWPRTENASALCWNKQGNRQGTPAMPPAQVAQERWRPLCAPRRPRHSDSQ
eukprot:3913693-Amphidinium_carterae.1